MENKDIIENTSLQKSDTPDLHDALDIIERRQKLWDRLMEVAIKSTTSDDWIDMDGKPYLEGTGAEKIARRFGISIFDVSQERENLTDNKGPYYTYITMGKLALPGGKEFIEAIGTCSSRDKFFGKKNGEYIPLEEVNVTNIRKKSYTNFVRNGVTKLLGLRGLTWDDLAKYGITPEGKTKVEFKKNQKQRGRPKKTTEQKPDTVWVYTAEDNKKILLAREGEKLNADMLQNVGMTKSQKTGNWYCDYDEDIEAYLNEKIGG